MNRRIRMALGAIQAMVLRLVVGRGNGGSYVRRCAGVVGRRVAWPVDWLTFIAIPEMLGAVCLLATYIPARRAARVDPTVSLRRE